MRDRDQVFTDRSQRLARKLALAAAVVLIVNSANSESRSTESNQLLFSPNLADSSASTLKPAKARSKPTGKKGAPSNSWAGPPHIASYPEAYWSTFDIDFKKGFDGSAPSKKFEYTSPLPGPTNSFDQLKIGDSYLGIETQRRLKTQVPSGKVDCATDEECEDYSALPKSKSRGSIGASSSSPSLLHTRKPFFGLSVTTPIE